MAKPKIGLISFVFDNVNPDFFVMWRSYIDAIQDAGGLPVLIPVTEHIEDCRVYLDMIDGLLIPGGEDIAPEFYGEDPVRAVNYVNKLKDRYELEMIRLVREQGKPIMAICRGMQIMNVALGGSLYQDLPSQVPASICHLQSSAIRAVGTHKVTFRPDSLIGSLLGEALMTNSFHHQALKEVAPGLRVVGETSDGIIEAVESEDGRIFCVQWHPERMYRTDPVQGKLFTHLVELSSK